MVDLGDPGHHAALEPFDDLHLPQRLAAVEGLADEIGGEGRELGDPTRGGQRGSGQMVVEVEGGILDPRRRAEAEGDLDEASPEGRQDPEPGLHQPAQPLEGIAAGNVGRVEDSGLGHVHVAGGRLEGEERRVETT